MGAKASGARRWGQLAAAKREKRAAVANSRAVDAYTVKEVCFNYMGGYLKPNRKDKGVIEVRRMFKAMLGPIESVPAASITRAQVFEFLNSYRATPALAARLRMELRGAWDYAMDAGRLPDGTPNWWRMILRGKQASPQGAHDRWHSTQYGLRWRTRRSNAAKR
ncbi:hypothetical protein [Burkholderia multivorans]|uniref:hypothetical protein n=1 Tax=Burkholderia multivorans TaxID=87883 RepID=UPI0020B236E4|nr:hypothetical protein [Burkholderia multivorans]